MKFLSRKSKEEKDENATKKCGDCMAEIPQKAKKCQHCGTKQKQKEQIGLKHLLLVGVIIVIFIVLFSGGSGGGGGGNTSKPQIDGQKAFIISQNYVEVALKSPASADFPSFEYNAQNLGSGKWKVASYVDAQNSFGANIRTNWTATLAHLGGDWASTNNWQLEELIVGGEIIYSTEKVFDETQEINQFPENLPEQQVQPKSSPPKPTTSIEGLGQIDIAANIEDHRLVVYIFYKKEGGSFLYVEDESLPISADVKIYKQYFLDKSKQELMFSKSYSSNEINISKTTSPAIIINPKEIDDTLDAKENSVLIEVTINTPEQGSFSAEDKMIAEEVTDLKYACVFISDCE